MAKPSATRARLRAAALKLMLAYPEIYNDMVKREVYSWRQPAAWHDVFDAVRLAPFTPHRLHLLTNAVRSLDRQCRMEQQYAHAETYPSP